MMNVLLPNNSTQEFAKSWFIQLVSDFGPGFHPDTDPVDYVDENNKPVFTKNEVDELNKSMDIVFNLLHDPYEIGSDMAMWMLS